jgi:hypothetical protein
MLLFLCVWLCGWAFGWISAFRSVLSRSEPFLVVWLTFWTLGGAFAVAVVAWSLTGREVITGGGTALLIRREVLGIGRTSEFDAAQVRNLRVAPMAFNPWDFRHSMSFWGLGGGPVAFDFGARTYRFGAGVEESEASSIAAVLRELLPASSS